MEGLQNKAKYKKWLERETKKGYSLNDLLPTIKFFEENQTKFEVRDIFQWDGKKLEDHIKEAALVSARKERLESRGEYEKMHEDDTFLIVRPDDKAAAMFWGLGTKWCITMKDQNYYDQYRDDNVVFYFLIDKTKKVVDGLVPSNDSKVAICFYRNKNNEVTKTEYYMSDDTCVTANQLPKHIKAFLEVGSESKKKSA